jgi:hypothetical protein
VIVTWFISICQLSILKTGQCRCWHLLHYGVVRSEPINTVNNLLRYVEHLQVPGKQLISKF